MKVLLVILSLFLTNVYLQNRALTPIKELVFEHKLNKSDKIFIIHGISAQLPESCKDFTEKYQVGFVVENCAIDPISFQRASENNQLVAKFLDKEYGPEWREDLPTRPLGVR